MHQTCLLRTQCFQLRLRFSSHPFEISLTLRQKKNVKSIAQNPAISFVEAVYVMFKRAVFAVFRSRSWNLATSGMVGLQGCKDTTRVGFVARHWMTFLLSS